MIHRFEYAPFRAHLPGQYHAQLLCIQFMCRMPDAKDGGDIENVMSHVTHAQHANAEMRSLLAAENGM